MRGVTMKNKEVTLFRLILPRHEKKLSLFEGFRVAPACPSDKYITEMKISEHSNKRGHIRTDANSSAKNLTWIDP